MQNYKVLALDESGKASQNHASKSFVLSGLIIPEDFKEDLDLQIRILKKKHLGDEEIILHSRDMLRKKGLFSDWSSNSEKEISFWSEYIALIDNPKIVLAIVVADKEKAKKLGWNDIAILRRSYRAVLEGFAINHLDENTGGKIIAESEPYQDKYLLEAHNRLQGMGVPSIGLSPVEYRKKLTSLSLVNKANLDVDVQIADSFATMADVVYQIKLGLRTNPSNVQNMMIQLINNKMADTGNPSIFEVLV